MLFKGEAKPMRSTAQPYVMFILHMHRSQTSSHLHQPPRLVWREEGDLSIGLVSQEDETWALRATHTMPWEGTFRKAWTA